MQMRQLNPNVNLELPAHRLRVINSVTATTIIIHDSPFQLRLSKPLTIVFQDYLDPGRKWSDVENTFLPPIGRIHITIKGRGLFNIYRFHFSKIISRISNSGNSNSLEFGRGNLK